MKNKLDQWITVIGFCAFLGIMSALFFLLPKEEMSETEKRVLETAPEYSWERLSSGQLGEDVESYMADHVPGRDFFVGVHNYTELLTGRQVTKDIYVAEGDRLVERPMVLDENTREQIGKNMTCVNHLANQVDAPVDLVIVPSAGWAVREEIKGLSDKYTDPEIIQQIYALAGQNVEIRDIVAQFDAYENPGDLYYRTDHHWTSLGAYEGYKSYMNHLGLPYRERSQFTVKTVDGFKGTTHSRAALWLVEGEPLEMWTGSQNMTVTFHQNGQTYRSVFFENRLEELDKYTVFLDGNHARVTIENLDAPIDETLLVIRDSYSNCLGPFLAETYKKVVLVDLRYFADSVADFCVTEDVDRVLVLYSLYNFTTDTNFPRLYTTNNITKMGVKTYDNETLEQIAAYEDSYQKLNATFPGGTTKIAGDSYRVSYLGEGSVAVLVFDSMGTRISGHVFATTCTRADLSGIAVGDSVEQVQEVHPDGLYMYTDSLQQFASSAHYTGDGFLVTIKYENDLITEITTELI